MAGSVTQLLQVSSRLISLGAVAHSLTMDTVLFGTSRRGLTMAIAVTKNYRDHMEPVLSWHPTLGHGKANPRFSFLATERCHGLISLTKKPTAMIHTL